MKGLVAQTAAAPSGGKETEASSGPGPIERGAALRKQSRPSGGTDGGVCEMCVLPSFLKIFPRTPMDDDAPARLSHHPQQQPAECSKQQAGESRISKTRQIQGGVRPRGEAILPALSLQTAHHPHDTKPGLAPFHPQKGGSLRFLPSVSPSIRPYTDKQQQTPTTVSRQPRGLCTCRRLKSGVWGNGVIGAAVLDNLHLSIEEIEERRDVGGLGNGGGWCSMPLTPSIPSYFQWCCSLVHPSLASSSRVSILYASSPVFPLPCVRDAISISSSSSTSGLNSLTAGAVLRTPPRLRISSQPPLAPATLQIWGNNGAPVQRRQWIDAERNPASVWMDSILLVHHISTSDGSELPQRPNLLQRLITRGQVQWHGESSLGFHELSRHDIPTTLRYRGGSCRPAVTVY
ncbi:hypothetical protein B0T18DRAFT_97830 [Schizothecium vesticola]|uniref:Uncharacterized protein n=1 Tax=Schizothecium vesticola TaxID=314040 RepID=A0AA40F0W4_9PEZI|nr:hypothetical protein B0T18DRAFT_97830 [Schizothecium vesticola]